MQAMVSNPTSLSMKFSDLTFEKILAIKVHVNCPFLAEVCNRRWKQNAKTGRVGVTMQHSCQQMFCSNDPKYISSGAWIDSTVRYENQHGTSCVISCIVVWTRAGTIQCKGYTDRQHRVASDERCTSTES